MIYLRIIMLTVLGSLGFSDAKTNVEDSNKTLYLAISGIDGGSLCFSDVGDYLPGNVFQYGTHVWIDLKKLYNTPYRRNTNLTYWTTFGGYGHSTRPREGFDGCIDDNKKTYVASGSFNTGFLKFNNVKVPGSLNTVENQWGTDIWINVFSQCHSQCRQGSWWKFEKNLTYDEAVQFGTSNDNITFAGGDVNGTFVMLRFKGNPSCSATSVYGCGPNELKE